MHSTAPAGCPDGDVEWTVGQVHCLVTLSCPTLCDTLDWSPPGSSVHGILQARILEWVAISFPRGLPDPGIKPTSPVSLASQVDFFFTG